MRLCGKTSNTLGGGPPRIETATRRPLHPLGSRHVPLEAESVESSGVQWCCGRRGATASQGLWLPIADHVELILNFNKSRLRKKALKK